MQSTKGQTTVTRNGDTFVYQKPWMKEPIAVKLEHIINTADLLIKQREKTEAALHFLANVLEAHTAHHPAALDEYAISGLSALCSCIAGASAAALDDYEAELSVIEAVAEQNRKG